jgi:hypothetical protein
MENSKIESLGQENNLGQSNMIRDENSLSPVAINSLNAIEQAPNKSI